MGQRRTYSAQFKERAVLMVTEQGYSFAEAARQLGIHENLIRNWKKRLEEKGKLAFPGQGKRPEQDELQRLREENKRLLQEREILKKATQFFAEISK